MSFHPCDMTAADRQALQQRFDQALEIVTGTPAGSVSQPWLEDVLGTPSDVAAEPRRRFETLTNKSSRQLLWRILAAQMSMSVPLLDALEGMKTHDFHHAFPKDLPELISAWQEGMKKDGWDFDFFLDYVAPVDFQEGLRMSLGRKNGSLQDALMREAH